MSNVYTRNRHPTGKEYYDVATDFYIELRRITGNPKIFPKRSMDKLFHELFGYDTKINRKENF